MEEKEKRKDANPVSRRQFIKGAGLVVGGVAAGAAVGACKTEEAEVPAKEGVPVPKEGAKEVPTTGVVEPAFEPEVTSIRGTSAMGFGRDGMPARVEVKNGKIVRIRPVRYAEEGYGPDYMKPWKIEVKGKVLEPPDKDKVLLTPLGLSYKKRVYSPNRIRYPLKRVDWEPGGDPAKINAQNRGISKYKRISWDEATTIIASELKRIQEKYGYFAVLAQGDGHGEGKCVHGPHGCQTQLLRHMGPDTQSSYTLQTRTPDSWEGWYWGGKHVTGWETTGTAAPQTNMAYEVMQNCEMLLVSTDPETTVWAFAQQAPSVLFYWFTELGVEQVYITPDLNYAAAVHADKWIPVLPCQDGALYLAVCYVWLTEGTYDEEYVKTHTVGFDKFADYVLGKEEGDPEGPKTPEWAAPRCGVPPWTIKALARNWYQKRTSIAGFMGPGRRGTYSTEPTRVQACAEGMQGYGAPGRTRASFMVGTNLPGRTASPAFDATLVKGEPAPARGLEEIEAPQDYFRPHQFIPKTRIHDAILNPPISWHGVSSPWFAASDQARPFTFPIPEEEGGTDIHMVWTDTPCWTTCWNGGNRYIQAFRDPKIEFVLTEHPWMENDTLLSDIILPTTTRHEEYDISAGWGDVWMVKNGIAPIGEAKTDYEVSLEVAKKLGDEWVEKYTWGKSVEDWMKHAWTTRDMEKLTGMTFEEFKEKEFWTAPYDPNWEDRLKDKPGGRTFYEDPKANPIKTPSGLLEYESSFLKENFPDDEERPPVPHWIPEGETHQDNPLGERGEKYPLLCQSNHGRWKVHAEHDDISWLREIPTCKIKGIDGYMYEPIWLHPTEAEKRGIKNGDIIGMYNERGMVLGGAYVTERIMPGVAYQDHGARVDQIVSDPDIPQSEWIDRGGANNLICPEKTISKNANGQVASGFLVEVKKVDINALKEQYPEAFEKPYDPATGLQFSAWVEGGEL
jgi:molybdopterin guanine dinucleotide-containing S/N-oxide reductase-like protein